jgi:outer membrane biosynthesis protein TonB
MQTTYGAGGAANESQSKALGSCCILSRDGIERRHAGSCASQGSGRNQPPAKHLVTPNVSDLSKELNLPGTVRIEVLIEPDGTLKKLRVIGGNPVLVMDAETAAQKSVFIPGPAQTTEVIEFKF